MQGHVLSPFLRIPITDLTGGLVSHQMLGRCGRIEMDYMECLEGYGLTRGLPKCNHLFEELIECQTLRKQYARFVAMRVERERQIASGKLTGDKKYLSPRIDSY